MRRKTGEVRRLAECIRELRLARKMTQSSLAEAVGLSRTSLVEIEAGRRRVDTVLLRKLARALGVQPWDLLEPIGEVTRSDVAQEALEAAVAEVPSSDKTQIRRLWTTLENYTWLLGKLGLDRPTLPASRRRYGASASKSVVRGEAIRVREMYGLGNTPCSANLRQWIETCGIPVFRFHLSRDSISGMFVNHRSVGPTILVNASQVCFRQIFTMAHEFAHVWLHRDEHVVASRIFATAAKTREIEEQANAFAAEFLMPESAIKRSLASRKNADGISPEDVVHLHRHFGVSYSAMLHRLAALRVVTQSRLKELQQESPVSRARRLGYDIDRSEVGETETLEWYEQLPAEYVELVIEAWNRDYISEGKAAEMLQTDQHSLNSYAMKWATKTYLENEIPRSVGG